MSADRAIIVAIGSTDPCGGAGLQTDVRTISALGCHPCTVTLAVTSQNSSGLHALHAMPAHHIVAQLEAITADFSPDAIKIGMLSGPRDAEILRRWLDENWQGPVVIDPVLAVSAGDSGNSEAAALAYRELLLPIATLLTPNIPEAEAIGGVRIDSTQDMASAAKRMLQLGARSVLLKGGHLRSKTADDLLLQPRGELWLQQPMLERGARGTGCALASAIACHLALGKDMTDAVTAAGALVHRWIKLAYGAGNHRVLAPNCAAAGAKLQFEPDHSRDCV